MREIVLSIEGMKCGGCAAAVDQKLSGVGGVKEVSVSFENSSAHVTADDSVTAEKLQSALNGTTYKAIPQAN